MSYLSSNNQTINQGKGINNYYLSGHPFHPPLVSTLPLFPHLPFPALFSLEISHSFGAVMKWQSGGQDAEEEEEEEEEAGEEDGADMEEAVEEEEEEEK